MTFSNRDYAVNMLRYWYNASNLAVLGFISFPTAIAYYESKHPTFLDQFGAAARLISIAKVKAGMESVAAANPTGYPSVSDFFNSIAASAQSFTAQDAKDVAAKTAADVGAFAGGLLSKYVVIIAVLAGAAIFLNMRDSHSPRSTASA